MLLNPVECVPGRARGRVRPRLALVAVYSLRGAAMCAEANSVL